MPTRPDIHAIDPDARLNLLRDALQAAAGGDRQAFETVYRMTSAKMFGICLRLLGQRADAEDVLQEAYVSIWNKAASFDPTYASPITWMAMITRNKVIDRLRRQRSEGPLDTVERLDELVAPAAFGASFEFRGERRRLDSCMERLEDAQRQLIEVAFFEGRSYAELAEHRGIPLGTVKSWIRRSLARLKGCLGL
ncbi:sigma-70 family RNA polymerase sigma factor [Pseudomonas fontis]|uniref:Sigma-70 family RNA polymerase sigma factor n=1 Tax=Pseudomonas fontis TaxID=2942633 RepID=A0ABT5NNM8_9PSED|nr:sigma-70 family RNA polymerase sigma factor [Pseudomonas fontis]MDD0973011.1 sigma-70 family RNA polymerase sigma factor [Pseudomonas fontis]MDD0989780.1 sigma-70 family RNA polymerase sigma factor [Pseudomonas fontis]